MHKIWRVQDKGSISLDAILIIALCKIFDHLKKVRVVARYCYHFVYQKLGNIDRGKCSSR